VSRRQRLAMLGVAVALAVAAFFVLRPAEDPSEREPTPAAESPSQSGQGTGTPEARPAPAKPRPVLIRTKDGKPVGGVRDITVDSGDTVRLQVRSDVPEEVHVHGYDRYIRVGPGRSGNASFEASLEGVYALELHGSGEQIASLRVQP
jgi:FtsP/CotA-like multicopper oxidase with cupredoxin domain